MNQQSLIFRIKSNNSNQWSLIQQKLRKEGLKCSQLLNPPVQQFKKTLWTHLFHLISKRNFPKMWVKRAQLSRVCLSSKRIKDSKRMRMMFPPSLQVSQRQLSSSAIKICLVSSQAILIRIHQQPMMINLKKGEWQLSLHLVLTIHSRFLGLLHKSLLQASHCLTILMLAVIIMVAIPFGNQTLITSLDL